MLYIKELHQTHENAKNKDKKNGKISRLSKIEDEKIRTNADGIMEWYASKDTNPVNDIRNLFWIEKDSFIKNTVLVDVPFFFEDDGKDSYWLWEQKEGVFKEN